MDAKEAVGFINVTRQCNVDCKRCYLTEAHRAARERLPLATLEAFLSSMSVSYTHLTLPTTPYV